MDEMPIDAARQACYGMQHGRRAVARARPETAATSDPTAWASPTFLDDDIHFHGN